MKAYIINHPGKPEVLELTDIPKPEPKHGEALIKIKAFGLNRAEAVTRMGGSFDAVKFPKVIGIECVGIVEKCPDGTLNPGQQVAAAMGGMGRKYNGSYAEYTSVPLSNVFPFESHLSWEELGAIPETFFTAWGCAIEALKVKENARILIRPGASALGLAVTQIVNDLNGEVIGVTRSEHKKQILLDGGMKDVIISGSAVENEIKTIWPEGATGILDTIVSPVTIADDLKIKAQNGRLCIAGSLADSYDNDGAAKLKLAATLAMPSNTFYSSETLNSKTDTQKLQNIIKKVENGVYKTNIFKLFSFDELIDAHIMMDKSQACGKLVVVI